MTNKNTSKFFLFISLEMKKDTLKLIETNKPFFVI